MTRTEAFDTLRKGSAATRAFFRIRALVEARDTLVECAEKHESVWVVSSKADHSKTPRGGAFLCERDAQTIAELINELIAEAEAELEEM